MIHSILNSVPKGNPRHPTIYYRMLDALDIRLEAARKKFVAGGLQRTAGVEMIRWILLNFNVNEAKSYTDDIALYTKLVSEYAVSVRNLFDPVWSKTLSRGKFIHGQNNQHPTEVFLNSTLDNPIDELPFGADWSEWRSSTRGIQLLYHNSSELPIDMFTGFVTFTKDIPSFVTISLNIPVLIMKYFKYLKWCETKKVECDEVKFIKEEEYDQFFYDLLDIWTTNLILRVLSNPDESVESVVEAQSIPQFLTSDGVISLGVSALKEQVNLVRSRNAKLQDFIDTSYYPGDRTIRDTIAEASDIEVVSDLRQYDWMKILHYLPYLRMISSIIDMDPTNPLFNGLIRKAYNIYVKRIKFVNMPSFQYAASVKTYVSLACNAFEKLFEGKVDAPVEATT